MHIVHGTSPDRAVGAMALVLSTPMRFCGLWACPPFISVEMKRVRAPAVRRALGTAAKSVPDMTECRTRNRYRVIWPRVGDRRSGGGPHLLPHQCDRAGVINPSSRRRQPSA